MGRISSLLWRHTLCSQVGVLTGLLGNDDDGMERDEVRWNDGNGYPGRQTSVRDN